MSPNTVSGVESPVFSSPEKPLSVEELCDLYASEFAAIADNPKFRQMRWFLSTLFKGYEMRGYIQFKSIILNSPTSFPHTWWWRLDEFGTKRTRDHRMKAIFREAMNDNAHDREIYFGVLPRDIQNGHAPAITRARWMWADLDFKVMSEDRLVERALAAGPDILVHTGGGLHWYKRLPEEMDLAVDRKKFVAACSLLQRSIVPGYNFDKTSDTPRVLRLPGTRNIKRGADVKIIWPRAEGVEAGS